MTVKPSRAIAAPTSRASMISSARPAGVAGRGDTGFGSAVRGVAVICLPWVRVRLRVAEAGVISNALRLAEGSRCGLRVL